MYLIIKLDAPGMGKRDVIEHVAAELGVARSCLRVGDPRRDIEVVSVVTATPKRLARVSEEMREGK